MKHIRFVSGIQVREQLLFYILFLCFLVLRGEIKLNVNDQKYYIVIFFSTFHWLFVAAFFIALRLRCVLCSLRMADSSSFDIVDCSRFKISEGLMEGLKLLSRAYGSFIWEDTSLGFVRGLGSSFFLDVVVCFSVAALLLVHPIVNKNLLGFRFAFSCGPASFWAERNIG